MNDAELRSLATLLVDTLPDNKLRRVIKEHADERAEIRDLITALLRHITTLERAFSDHLKEHP